MKNPLLILILFVSVFHLRAQQGSMYIGGGLGFAENYWKIAPETGIWLKDNFQLGAVLTFTGEENETTDVKSTTIAPHLYGRLWFPAGEKFSLYIGANGRINSTSYDPGNSDSYVDVFLDAGFAYSLAERWGMVGRVVELGIFNEDFMFDLNMSPQSLFDVGIYYTFKQ